MENESPPTPFAVKAIYAIIVISVAVPAGIWLLFVGAVGVIVAIMDIEDHETRRADNNTYDASAVGKSWRDVEDAYGRVPDFATGFYPFRVYYYIDHVRHSTSPDSADSIAFVDVVDNKDDFPDPEGAKQYLVLDGVVIACTWIGGDPFVHYTDGKIEGRSIRDLPEEFLERAR